MKKAAVIFNFCFPDLFLVPKMIELVPKTFMSIETPDLCRVYRFDEKQFGFALNLAELNFCIFVFDHLAAGQRLAILASSFLGSIYQLRKCVLGLFLIMHLQEKISILPYHPQILHK